MNKHESGVAIVVVLVVAFIFVAYALPTFVGAFTGYAVEVVLGLFGVAAIVIVINFYSGSRRR